MNAIDKRALYRERLRILKKKMKKSYTKKQIVDNVQVFKDAAHNAIKSELLQRKEEYEYR